MARRKGACCAQETVVYPPCKSCDGGGKMSLVSCSHYSPPSFVRELRKTLVTCKSRVKKTRNWRGRCVQRGRSSRQTCHSPTGAVAFMSRKKHGIKWTVSLMGGGPK